MSRLITLLLTGMILAHLTNGLRMISKRMKEPVRIGRHAASAKRDLLAYGPDAAQCQCLDSSLRRVEVDVHAGKTTNSEVTPRTLFWENLGNRYEEADF